MERKTIFWLLLFVVSGLFLSYRAITTDMGNVYVRTTMVERQRLHPALCYEGTQTVLHDALAARGADDKSQYQNTD